MYLAVLGQPLRRLYGMLGCGHGIYRSSLIISAYEIRAWPCPDGPPPTNVVQLEDRMEQGTRLVAAIHGNMQSMRKEILWEAGILALKDRQKRTARTAGNRYKMKF